MCSYLCWLYHFVFTEICEDCLTLSANKTVVAVGSVVMIVNNIRLQPHSGISLFIDGEADIYANPYFLCHITSDVLGQQIIYHCTGRRSGTVTVQTNTVFCDTDLSSQQINVTIKENRMLQHKMEVSDMHVRM